MSSDGGPGPGRLLLSLIWRLMILSVAPVRYALFGAGWFYGLVIWALVIGAVLGALGVPVARMGDWMQAHDVWNIAGVVVLDILLGLATLFAWAVALSPMMPRRWNFRFGCVGVTAGWAFAVGLSWAIWQGGFALHP